MEPTDEPLQAAESADSTSSEPAIPVPPRPATSEADPAPIADPESNTAPEGTAAVAPEPEPEPPSAAEVAAADTAPDPVIASTVTIPAQDNQDNTEQEGGGEWNLLVEKIKAWIDSNALGSLWTQAQLPLRVIGGVILFVIVSTIYSGILGTINKVPLAPGLLELFGLIWLVNYASSNLVRSSDRKRVIDALGSTWNKIVGR